MRRGLGLRMGGKRGGGGATAAVVITSVTPGTISGSNLPITVVADAANGNGVYWVIVPEAAAAPEAANVRALQANGGGAPTESGSSTWPGPFSDPLASGITSANYILYMVIENAGGLSNVAATAPFNINTVTALNKPTLIASQGGSSTSQTKTLNLSAMASGAKGYLAIATVGGSHAAATAITVQGNTATVVGQSASTQTVEVWEFTMASAGSAAADVIVTRATAPAWGVAVWEVTGGTVTTETVSTGAITSASNDPISVNVNTSATGAVIGVCTSESTEAHTWVGATEDAEFTVGGASRVVSFASAQTTTAETPRTISCDPTTATPTLTGRAMSVALS